MQGDDVQPLTAQEVLEVYRLLFGPLDVQRRDTQGFGGGVVDGVIVGDDDVGCYGDRLLLFIICVGGVSWLLHGRDPEVGL